MTYQLPGDDDDDDDDDDDGDDGDDGDYGDDDSFMVNLSEMVIHGKTMSLVKMVKMTKLQIINCFFTQLLILAYIFYLVADMVTMDTI